MASSRTRGFFSGGRNEDIYIPWDKIIKVGIDTILIDGRDIAGLNY
jgi:sporulation protein YlmC with PRC-barrel domain